MTVNIGGGVYCPAELEIKSVDDSILINNISKNISLSLNKTASKIWDIIIESQNSKKTLSCRDIGDILMDYYSLNQSIALKVYGDVENVLTIFINTGVLIRCSNDMSCSLISTR